MARLLSVGYGGQVLLSAATQHLVRGQLPEGSSLRDFGEHRLRELLEPEHGYQLLADGLHDAFPALKSPEHQLTNLPALPGRTFSRMDSADAVQISD